MLIVCDRNYDDDSIHDDEYDHASLSSLLLLLLLLLCSKSETHWTSLWSKHQNQGTYIPGQLTHPSVNLHHHCWLYSSNEGIKLSSKNQSFPCELVHWKKGMFMQLRIYFVMTKVIVMIMLMIITIAFVITIIHHH